MDDSDKQSIRSDFDDAVNMTPEQLEDWLETDESQSAGDTGGEGESTGHASGRRIVEILRTKEDGLDDGAYQHMRKVTGYVHRHLAQRPEGDVTDTKWRHSLMNWGHDPQR